MKNIMIAGDHITAYGLKVLIETDLIDCKATHVDTMDIPDILSGNVPCDLLVYIGHGRDEKAERMWVKRSVPILHITDGLGFTEIQALYRNGAFGVVDISNPPCVVLGAIGEALRGHIFMEQAFKEQLLKGVDAHQAGTLAHGLTKREQEVAELMLEGKRMCEIGQCLGLKASTVTTFKAKVFEKLGVDSLLGLNEAFRPRRK